MSAPIRLLSKTFRGPAVVAIAIVAKKQILDSYIGKVRGAYSTVKCPRAEAMTGQRPHGNHIKGRKLWSARCYRSDSDRTDDGTPICKTVKIR